jgi:four helix bundle protein
MGEFQFQFEKLKVWQEARELVALVYQLLERFPRNENYVLCDQLRRAAISVPSNIAEGSGRFSIKEQVHFFEIAFGSLMELYCQLLLAADLGYISEEDVKVVKARVFSVTRMLSRLRASKISDSKK